MSRRAQIHVRGVVQGVGFRPFVFRRAQQRELKGQVFNDGSGVLIDIEGESNAVAQFIAELKSNPPPRSKIESIQHRGDLPAADFPDFRILISSAGAGKSVPVSSDIATCDACLEELFDPNDRRYGYPFINCTQCGPRFTIAEEVPYDRATTTMREFAMCSHCEREYDNPLDRRFHAEPIACPSCGPQILLIFERPLEPARAATPEGTVSGADAIGETVRLLDAGKIVAIKGIGGFHLACDAGNGLAVARMRERKRREEKPFAMMADSLETISRFCDVSEAEKRLLESSRRPIVLLKKKAACELPSAVAPGVNTLGFMLPYAPLHHLFFSSLKRPLVMTSGNLSEDPIAFNDADAMARLGAIADAFLLHNRRIHMRADDSVTRAHARGTMVLRRGRGYAPEPIKIPIPFKNEVLACGAHLKNSFCFTRRDHAYLSHHIGDLENYETYNSFAAAVDHYKRLFDLQPLIVAHDLHPHYLSTRYAMETDIPTKMAVQHHHAHVASCMIEHGIIGPVIGVVFDGLGYGEDGAIWGGEFFIARLESYRRAAHFRYIPLAGGDTAIRQPWRSALSYLQDAVGNDFELPGWPPVEKRNLAIVQAMIRQDLNTIRTSSCGRLFDAVASLVGLRHEIRYEAQAAIELEAIVVPGIIESYQFDIGGRAYPWEIDFRATIEAIVRARQLDERPGIIAARFHNTLVRAIVEVCRRMREQEGLKQICLSGGCFQNRYLLEHVLAALQESGFSVYCPSEVPPNDGGIALGQAAIAGARAGQGG